MPRILITYPYSMGSGGGGTIGCIQIAKHLVAAGADVTIATVTTLWVERSLFRNPPLAVEKEGREQEAELRDAGVTIVRIPPHPVHYHLDCIPTRSVVKSLLAEDKFDAALGWHQEYAYLPRMLKKAGVITGLFTSGWYRAFKNTNRILPHLKKFVHIGMERYLLLTSLRKVDVVFAISEFTRGEVSDSFDIPHERFQVAHWGVDPIFQSPQRTPEPAVRRFVFFGSPNRRKGGFETLEAFAEVDRRGHRDWQLKIIWPYREELERAAAEHGLSNRVILLDPLDHEGLVRELAWAQVAILPSKFESFGLACAEALATGSPVIAYDVGGVSEVVRPGEAGWLVENARVDLLPDPIIEAMSDPQRTHAMGMAGRQHVTSRYSWDKTAETILGRLERLIAVRGLMNRPG